MRARLRGTSGGGSTGVFTAAARFVRTPGRQQFKHGLVSFAGSGDDSRLTGLFIARADINLGQPGSPCETPFGRLVGDESFDTVRHNAMISHEQLGRVCMIRPRPFPACVDFD